MVQNEDVLYFALDYAARKAQENYKFLNWMT